MHVDMSVLYQSFDVLLLAIVTYVWQMDRLLHSVKRSAHCASKMIIRKVVQED